jgi:hypothetical protein
MSNDLPTTSVCRYCNRPIRHVFGIIWHDASHVFPQYCPNYHGALSSVLHEPAPVNAGTNKET